MAQRNDPFREMERLLGTAFRSPSAAGMPLDLYRTGETFVVKVDLPGVDPDALAAATSALLATEHLEVQRMTKTGLRAFDARGAVEALTLDGPTRLRVVLTHQAPLVRPDDVVQALGKADPRFTLGEPAVLTRLAQGRSVEGRIVGPFEAASGA